MSETSPTSDAEPGSVGPIEWALRISTGLHVVLSLVSIPAGGGLRAAIAVLFFAAFCVGLVASVWAFFVAASRSRDEQVTVVGAFFLGDGAVPVSKRRALWGLVALQVVVGFGVSIARPFTPVAASLLVPLLGVGLAGLYGAREGRFAKRVPSQ